MRPVGSGLKLSKEQFINILSEIKDGNDTIKGIARKVALSPYHIRKGVTAGGYYTLGTRHDGSRGPHTVILLMTENGEAFLEEANSKPVLAPESSAVVNDDETDPGFTAKEDESLSCVA